MVVLKFGMHFMVCPKEFIWEVGQHVFYLEGWSTCVLQGVTVVNAELILF